jgi:hypothetical protein
MILRFGLLMMSVSSSIFISQVLRCLNNSSSVFPLITKFQITGYGEEGAIFALPYLTGNIAHIVSKLDLIMKW